MNDSTLVRDFDLDTGADITTIDEEIKSLKVDLQNIDSELSLIVKNQKRMGLLLWDVMRSINTINRKIGIPELYHYGGKRKGYNKHND